MKSGENGPMKMNELFRPLTDEEKEELREPFKEIARDLRELRDHYKEVSVMNRFPEELQEFLQEHGVTQKELDIWGSDTVDAVWLRTVKKTILDALKERKQWNDGYKEWAKKKGLPI